MPTRHKMIVQALLVILGLILSGIDISYAQTLLTTGTPETYKVTITKFEISSDGGSTYITLFDGGSVEIDIASVAAGQAAGNFFSGLTVPDGTYTHVRVTPSATFKMLGSIDYGGTTYYTTADGTQTTTAGDQVEASIDVQGGVSAGAHALPQSITVKNGAADKKVRVEFDVTGTLGLYDTAAPGGVNAFFPQAPTVTMAIN